MVARHGKAFNSEIEWWGDSRGEPNYTAPKHMKVCAVKSMTGYQEDYSWIISDTCNREDSVGIRAFITCECGQVEHVSFIVEDAGLSTILGWLLEDEN